MQIQLCEAIITALRPIKQSKTVFPIYQIPIKLLLVQKKQIMYVTDGSVIIQAIMCLSKDQKSNRVDFPKPFNIIRTNFYNFNVKYCNMFMFNQQDNYETKYHSVYHPVFHFTQDRIAGYRKQNAVNGFDSLNQVLVIKEWSFRIVNVANTGYYGIVLEICSYQRIRLKYQVNQNIHSILYEKSIVQILQALRIRQMREQIGIPKRDNEISLCYYRKNIKSTRNNKTHKSNFVNSDKNCKYIKFNPQIRQYYIPLGDISGALRFIRPLLNYTENKRALLNFNLFQPREISQNNQSHLSSSSDDDGDQIGQDIGDLHSQHQSQSSSYDDDEPLKLIYHKQLEKIPIV